MASKCADLACLLLAFYNPKGAQHATTKPVAHQKGTGKGFL